MPRRLKFIIALVIVAGLVILFILGLRGRAKKTVADAPQSVSRQSEAAVVPAVPPRVLSEGERVALTTQLTLENLARSFAERFGSYSNQGQFENIEELYPLMTETLRTASEQEITRSKATAVPGNAVGSGNLAEYVGTTTQARNGQVLNRDDIKAEVLVMTQRKETKADGSPARLYEQGLKLTFRKEGTEWKVERAEWQ